jgi:hypothetical protein
MRRRFAAPLVLALFASCSGGDAGDAETPPPDSITQRQRDSAVGASGLPGSGGVRGALDASDAAADRAARMDSIARSLDGGG